MYSRVPFNFLQRSALAPGYYFLLCLDIVVLRRGPTTLLTVWTLLYFLQRCVVHLYAVWRIQYRTIQECWVSCINNLNPYFKITSDIVLTLRNIPDFSAVVKTSSSSDSKNDAGTRRLQDSSFRCKSQKRISYQHVHDERVWQA